MIFAVASTTILLPFCISPNDYQQKLDFERDCVEKSFRLSNLRQARGPDNLDRKIVNICSEQLVIPYTKTFQRSIDDQIIPKPWKESIIIPVPKNRTPNKFNDYRPVALTSIVMKCFEKIVKSELLNTVYKNLDPLQFAYQHSLGVEDALLTVYNTMTSHLDKSSTNFARILYVDFSSAFNAMDTNVLLDKLCKMKVPQYLVNWYRDFLCDRPQRVRLGTDVSGERMLSIGCPQGCVSSPLLYIIYTNDCKSSYENCLVVKYADDTAIVGLLNDSESEITYQKQIQSFTQWCDENYLTLNVSKTKEQIFDFRNRKHYLYDNIEIKNQAVEIVENFKYLGITIDSALKFKPHVNNVVAKAYQRMHILRKLRSFEVNNKTMVQIFKSLVLSIITFSMSVWYGSCGVKEKNKIQRISNECSKITNSKLEPISREYIRAVERKTCSIVISRRHPLYSDFKTLPSGRRFAQPRCRTNRYKSTFIPTAISILNSNKRPT